MRTRKSLFSAMLVIFLLLTGSCAKNPVSGKRQLMLMSTEQEKTMGKQADPEIVNFFGLYEDANIQRFIQEKGKEMAALSHRKELNYEFKIVDSPVVNAFAVPGGYIYFTRGILAHFNNEAEFAGVLGHEIGHVAARHSAQQYSKSVLAQVGLVVGVIVSPTFRQFADIAQTGVGLLFLKYGRNHERESDKLGVEYASKIGYDAQKMAEFFNTLDRMREEQGGQVVPNILSTHPNPKQRAGAVSKLASEWKKKLNLASPNVNRESYLKMIDGLVYGEDPKQGFVENNIFYHPELKFQFQVPADWQHQNSPQQFQMVAKDGNALMILTLSQGNNLEAAAQEILKKYQLTLVESKKETVNGLNALAMIADQKQEQQTIRTLTYLIDYGGSIYNLIGVSLLNNFNNYFQTFSGTMQSFSILNDAEKINRQPDRIRIVSVGQRANLSQILTSNGVPQNKLEELALLNGMALNETVEQGMLVKVIGK